MGHRATAGLRSSVDEMSSLAIRSRTEKELTLSARGPACTRSSWRIEMWHARSSTGTSSMPVHFDIGILIPLRLPSAKAVEVCLSRLIMQLRKDETAKFMIAVGFDRDDLALHGRPGPEQQNFRAGDSAWRCVDRNLRNRFPGLTIMCVVLPPTSPFATCAAWNLLARAASREGSQFFLLLGDDVEVVSDTWFQQIMAAFQRISTRSGFGLGVGCVAAVEFNSPSWPSFPVVHQWHLNTLRNLFPVANNVQEAEARIGFYNQDADVFLWELYRRLGLTEWTSSIILENRHGGVSMGLLNHDGQPRYQPVHVEWRLNLLQTYLERLRNAFDAQPMNTPDIHLQVTMDVIVPSYRVDIPRLRSILNLQAPASQMAQIRFVIVIDRPLSQLPVETRTTLREMETLQRDVRIRCSGRNDGASAARSMGARDCHSEWILFLDDDVVPNDDLLSVYVRAIQAHGGDNNVRGFVGLSRLQFGLKQSTMAFHFADVSCFWHIAEWIQRPPWGVTANLVLRWWPGLRFDTRFPKTGGGEDIDICIAARSPRGSLVAVPQAEVVHPWWNNGARWSLWRRAFWWAYGDGMLLSKYPGYTFLGTPNVVEVTILLLLLMRVVQPWTRSFLALFLLAFWVADYVTGCVYCQLGTTIRRFPAASRWLLLRASLESSTVRQVSDLGRFYGFLRRGEIGNMLCRRLDWFLGTRPRAIGEQRVRGLWTLAVAAAIVLATLSWIPAVFIGHK